MHKRALIVFCLFCVASAAYAQAYRWTDENGVVHYSDRPQPGAEEFVLPDTSVPSRIIPPRRDERASATTDAPVPQEPDEGYDSLSIVSPVAEETLWNIQGNLTVQLSLQPSLKQGHQIRVYVDGTPRLVSSTTFGLTDVFRGSHNLQAEVLDEQGQLQIRSEAIQFYVQQTTVIGGRRAGPAPR